MNNGDFARYSKRIVQYFWDPLPANDDASPIWCLATQYESKPRITEDAVAPHGESPPQLSASQASTTSSVAGASRSHASSDDDAPVMVEDPTASEADRGWPSAFLDDFESRIWMTYRSNFTPIPKSQDPKAMAAMSFSVRIKSQLTNQGGFTSDSGWGCMIRSGQGLLANALSILHLGRDWRRGDTPEEERKLLSLFSDDKRAPFSIHRFVEYGAAACGKHPGEWFGPSATARSIQALTKEHPESKLKVYITGDGSDVYEDAFMKVAKASDGAFTPTLVLVGIRLGIDRVTPVYWEALKASLMMPHSIGIAGGRPSASHLFVGTQGSHFFYLDPHVTKPFLPYHTDSSEYTKEDIDSCHMRRIRRCHISEMDPSMLIGFLIRDEADWKDWRGRVAETPGKAVLNVADREPSMHEAGFERESAIDEVEAFDDDEDEHEDNDTVKV